MDVDLNLQMPGAAGVMVIVGKTCRSMTKAVDVEVQILSVSVAVATKDPSEFAVRVEAVPGVAVPLRVHVKL